MIARTFIRIALTFLIFPVAMTAQDTLPNPDFEQWITSTLPKDWSSTNSLLPAGNFVCFRTTNSHTGDYAVQLKTIDLDGFPVPGVLTLGYVGMGFTAGGIGFTQKPTSLKGFIRHPSYGDEVMIIVEFYKNGNEIGGGFWSTTDSIGDYTQFVVPITFQSTDDPDTLNITILTDQGQVGSSMQVDALEFEFTTTSLKENGFGGGFLLQPNPCVNRLQAKIEKARVEEVSVFDLSGRMVLHSRVDPSGGIDVSSLHPGVYVAEVQYSGKTVRQKFIKQ